MDTNLAVDSTQGVKRQLFVKDNQALPDSRVGSVCAHPTIVQVMQELHSFLSNCEIAFQIYECL